MGTLQVALGISVLSMGIYTLLGSIKWDLSGQVFLNQLTQQFALMGQNINDLPAGLTPQMMLIIYFIGGLTIFNILPGIITGFGEEFGWRGLMFTQMYKIKPWIAFIVGGLIWYAWHIPLTLVIAQTQHLTIAQTILNVAVLAVGSICTHTFLSYVYVKSENIWVASVAHITLDNVARSFAYFIVLQNQFTANIGLAITMLIVVAVLYFSKEWRVFENYFSKNQL
jgi:membrane protease YdiL (CAAX protease family)